jgi:hypothetical protein
VIVGIVVFAGVGSIVLSLILGGDGFDHLFAGFMPAAPGMALMRAFGVHLWSPAEACSSPTPTGLSPSQQMAHGRNLADLKTCPRS